MLGDPVVTLTGDDFIRDGAIIVEGPTITAVGTREELEGRGSFDRIVGSRHNAILPGFINGHFHSGGVGRRGLSQYTFERANLYAGGKRSIPSEEALFDAVAWSLIECIRGGQTCTVDFSYGLPLPQFGHEIILEAYAAVGMRGALGVVTRDQNLYAHGDERFLSSAPAPLSAEVRRSPLGYAWPTDRVFSVYADLVEKWDNYEGRLRVILAPDWTPACSDELYRRNRQLATEYGTGITTHCLETRSEMIFNLKRYGKTAVRRLYDLGILDQDVSLAHFVWATDEDLSILADTGAVAVNNPGSNLRLSTGICRLRDIIDNGGSVSVGTDSISFSESEDYFQELRLALYLQRCPGPVDAERVPSALALRHILEGGARAARFEGVVGALSPGMNADLLVVSTDRVNWPPGRYQDVPFLDVLLDRASAVDIRSVMIAGKLVLDDGHITTMDEKALAQRVVAYAAHRAAPSPEERRWARLARSLEPYVSEFYRPWSEIEIEPAYRYNAARSPTINVDRNWR